MNTLWCSLYKNDTMKRTKRSDKITKFKYKLIKKHKTSTYLIHFLVYVKLEQLKDQAIVIRACVYPLLYT